MKERRKLTAEQAEEARNLRQTWDRKSQSLGLTQASASKFFGFANQSAVSQYLNARIPLNAETTLRFAKLLEVDVAEISPRTAALVSDPHKNNRALLGIPNDPQIVQVTPELKKVAGDFTFLVVDRAVKSIDDGLFLVAIGGSETVVRIERSETDLTIFGVSEKPMHVPLQAIELISVKGKVTHKIYRC